MACRMYWMYNVYLEPSADMQKTWCSKKLHNANTCLECQLLFSFDLIQTWCRPHKQRHHWASKLAVHIALK